MTLATGEFIRRFLIHVLPQGFHRIRHGLFFKPLGSLAKSQKSFAMQSVACNLRVSCHIILDHSIALESVTASVMGDGIDGATVGTAYPPASPAQGTGMAS
jgi:hypothetical protein